MRSLYLSLSLSSEDNRVSFNFALNSAATTRCKRDVKKKRKKSGGVKSDIKLSHKSDARGIVGYSVTEATLLPRVAFMRISSLVIIVVKVNGWAMNHALYL